MYTEIIMTDSVKLNVTTITDSGIKNNNPSTKQSRYVTELHLPTKARHSAEQESGDGSNK